MTRETHNGTHFHSLPNRAECYPNNLPVKTTSYRVIYHRSRKHCSHAGTYRDAAQPALENIPLPLWTVGNSPTCDFATSPQTDAQAPADTRRKLGRRLFAALSDGGAAQSRETSVCMRRGASCWREYARSPISLNRGPAKVAPRSATTCAKFFHSSCFFGRFGRKTVSRTICASLALVCAPQSAARQASILPTTRKSPRSCAANTASNSYSTSWAMRGHPGSRRSAKPRTLARCVVNSPNSNAGSRRWKWASNKEAS